MLLGSSPEFDIIAEFGEADGSESTWDSGSTHREVNIEFTTHATSKSDVTVVQVEASIGGVFTFEADVFADPHVTGLIVSEEEGIAIRCTFALSGTGFGVGVSSTLSDVLGIEV